MDMDKIDRLPRFRITEQLYAGSRTLVYRGIQEGDGCPVVLKMLRNPSPSFRELVQFRNQYTIAQNLNLPSIVKLLTLEPCKNGYVLVMEDFGGISLKEFLAQTGNLGDRLQTLTTFFLIAIQLADALNGLFHHRVIHKDIKLANILIHPDTQQVKLIDFSIASLLSHETQEVQNANVLEGTLPYLSPEQTGRMNRGIDYRSDFYALGITFYELLTGQLPFTSSDPMELIHCHLAKQPIPVDRINPTVPSVLSEIIRKLMAKNAEDRYQSALGLKHDLEVCLAQLNATGTIAPFELNQRDLCDRFLISEKLYGRQSEVAALLSAFDRVSDGQTEMILVAGFSGIGKTAVVHEVHKPIVRQRGYFIKGKFDQFNRNIPFSAFVQAFRDLMGELLSESDTQLQTWKTQILEAVGENGQVIVDVIPELERIIGAQPAAVELSGTAAQNRFNLLFQKFIQIFTTADHPLVMFLDDLQWADSASLSLMQLLMTSETGYLLLIGAYRDNEVFAAHPLLLTLDMVKKSGVMVNTITLQPLSQESLNHLVADTLNCSEGLAQPLTDLVMQKTQGNPFFATQFLKALHQEGLITFDGNVGHWQCDIVQVRSAALTDDVVEFMAVQLQKLPIATQQVLKLAACIGAQFDLNTLAIVSEKSETEVAAALWKALQAGLILPQSEVYKFYIDRDDQDLVQSSQIARYRFLHDRVQQAAYSLIPEDQKQSTHLLIGRLLLKSTSDSETDANIFEIVNHWNDAIDLIIDPLERMKLAKLNLTAGQKAKSSAAYESALKYINTGISLLLHNGWQTQYDLALALYTVGAESALLYGDYPQMDALIEAVLHHAKEILDTIKIYKVKIQGSIVQNQQQDCLDTGLSVLQQLGVPLETQPPNRVESIQELIHLPEMDDPYKLAATDILIDVITPAWTLNPEIFQQTIFTLVNLSFTCGHCPATAFGYAWYGTFLCETLGDIDSGYQFGLLALQLLDKFDANGLRSSVNDLFATHIGHWKDHTRTTLPFHLEGLRHGLETGNLEYAGYGAAEYCQYLFLVGESLDAVEEKCRYYLALIQKLQLKFHILYLAPWQQGVMNLRRDFDGQSTQLIGECYDEREHLQRIVEENQLTLGFCNFFVKALLCFLFADYEKAIEYSRIALQNRGGVFGTYFIPTTVFYASLSLLANYSNVESVQQQQYRQQIIENLLSLETCATDAPMNHEHKFNLVKAEYCRVLGQNHEAIDYYDRAIQGAKANEYIQEEALSNELAAKFYLDWGKEKVAAGYMQEAYYCYARWGAKAKTDDLENRYPQLLQPILQQAAQPFTVLETLASIVAPATDFSRSKSSSSSSINDTLDFAALLKVGQDLASTIELDELLQTLTQTMLENSGADKCALMLCQDDQWQVRVMANLEQVTLQSAALENNPTVPVKLIQYVKNTLATIVMDDLDTKLSIIGDYLHEHQPQSVLCLPILNQGNLAGILYLENRATSGVFTNDRLLILNFLCNQAASALENARLYQTLQHSESEFRALVEEVNDMIYSVALDTTFTYLSPQFKEMWGYNVDEFLHQSFVSLVHPEDLAYVTAVMQRLVETGEKQSALEFRTQHRDRSWFWITCNISPIKDEQGQVTGLRGIAGNISDRKRTEDQLRENELLLRSIYEGVGQGIGVINVTPSQDFHYISWNLVLNKLTGIPNADIAGKTPEEVFGKTFGALIRQNYQHCLAAATAISYEELVPFQGKDMWWLTTLNPLKNEDGQMYRIIMTAVEISDRKAVEQSQLLHYKTTQLLADAESLEIAIPQLLEVLCKTLNWSLGELWVFDSATETLKLDQTWHLPSADLAEFSTLSRTSRFARGDGLPGQVWETEAPLWITDVCQDEQFLRRDIASQCNLHTAVGFPIHRTEGVWDVLILFTHKIHPADNSFLEMIANISSQIGQFSDRKAAEDALRQSEQRFRDVTEAAGEYIWEIDTNGIYTYATERSTQVKGYSPKQLLGHSPIEFMPPEDIESVGAILAEASARKGSFTLQHRDILPTGEVVWEEISGLPILNDENEIIGFRGTGLSITDRKASEALIQAKNQELAQALQDLQQTQLQMVQSEKMSALGNLVAGVAHEINNPVGCIVGNVEVVQEYINDLLGVVDLYGETFPQPGDQIADELEDIDLDYVREDLPKLIKAMKDGGDRIKSISQSLRTFSRSDSDQKQPFNLHDGIDSTILILRHRLNANDQRPKVEVVTDYGNLPAIDCFPGQLNQVFMNLLANAIDALEDSNQGRSSAEIKANPNEIIVKTEVSADRQQVVVRVKDNGMGMSDAVKRKIFDHLFTTKGVGQGTGLGLAIARQIVVEKHGGTLEVNSDLGQGAEFIITIPVKATVPVNA